MCGGGAGGRYLVESFNTVGGEEENALEVLEEAQEDANQRIAVEVVAASALKEDVGFVQKEHCSPSLGCRGLALNTGDGGLAYRCQGSFAARVRAARDWCLARLMTRSRVADKGARRSPLPSKFFRLREGCGVIQR